MWDDGSFFTAIFEVLRVHDRAAALALLAAIGRAADAPVELPEGDATVEDCVTYAEALFDLGRDDVAHDVLIQAMAPKAA